MSTEQCFGCNCYEDGNVYENSDVQLRCLRWNVRPKEKYNKSDYMSTLDVHLCEECWGKNKKYAENEYLVGCDWWSAVDGLE